MKPVTARKRKAVKKKVGVENTANTGGDVNVLKQAAEVDGVMLEYHQFVMYHDMKKKTEELMSSQEKILSQGRSSSRQEGTQHIMLETGSIEAHLENFREKEQPNDRILVANEDKAAEVQNESLGASVLRLLSIVRIQWLQLKQDNARQAKKGSQWLWWMLASRK